MKALFEGLFTVFKHLFMKPVTLEYPEKKPEIPDAFRGKPVVKGCIGCGICQKVCPSGAISIVKTMQGEVISYVIDAKKCIFCGNCEYYCPKDAIQMTKDYELASEDKNDLKFTYRGGEDD